MWAETLGYRESRIQLTTAFFAALARAAKVAGNDDLLDLGSGPGEVTLGMAPYGGRMAAIDCEQPMLDELARRARSAGREIRMIHTRVEEAPLDLGHFRLITIGQAHWFMHHPGTFERLDRWLAEGGTVALCISLNVSSSPWAESLPDHPQEMGSPRSARAQAEPCGVLPWHELRACPGDRDSRRAEAGIGRPAAPRPGILHLESRRYWARPRPRRCWRSCARRWRPISATDL